MSSLKKNYTYSTKRNIWRLIPTSSNLLVIEERDTASKEVFFNCITLDKGNIILKNYQLEEKYWAGIEAADGNIIFFHSFKKPNMPAHKGIYAFDVFTKKFIWQNEDLLFYLIKDKMVYAFQQTFEGRKYFVLDALTGKIIREFENGTLDINKLREEAAQSDFANTFLFPKNSNPNLDASIFGKLFEQFTSQIKIEGTINFLTKNDLVMFSYHKQNSDHTFDNCFKVYHIKKSKIILDETLNSKSKNLMPDSFFIVENLLLLLIEKNKLAVYRIMP